MILALDIGNSSVKAGLWNGECIVHATRVTVPSDLEGLVAQADMVSRAGAVSVVPEQNAAWSQWVFEATGQHLTLFTAHSRLPFSMQYETPDTLGADRVAAAVGAWCLPPRMANQSAIVLDAGTALNVELVRSEGAYAGGIIAPGPELMRRALNAGTAQLPLIPLVDPSGVAGASTEKALQSGVMNGFLAMTQGLLAKLLAEGGLARQDVHVVATGGWAAWLADRMDGIDEVRPNLVLEGVAALVEYGVNA